MTCGPRSNARALPRNHRRLTIPPLTAEFSPTAPFNFDLAIEYLRGSPSAVIEQIDGGCYLRAVRINGRTLGLRISSAGDIEHPRLHVHLLGDAAREDDLPAAVALARRIFTTDEAIVPLFEVSGRDLVFGRLVERVRGLRPVVIPDPFEAVVWAILGQQINISFAARLKRALVERFGSALTVDGSTLPLFPSPSTLAELEHERDLLPLQFSRQKSRYIIELARAVTSGAIDLTAIGELPADGAIAALTRLPGIGLWTAEYALMRAYGHRDVMPAGDGGLKQIIGREYGLGRLATEAEVRERGEAWSGWRGYAAFYWWFQLQREAAARRRA